MSKRSVIRKVFRQPVDNDGVDEVIAGVLAAPTGGEARLAKAVRDSGGDDSVEVTAVAAKRALTALVKAYKAAGRPVPANVLDGLAGDDSDDDDVDEGPPPGAWTTYDARREIEDEDADKKRALKKKPDEEGDAADVKSPFDALSKEDASSLLEAIRDVMPEWAADRVQKEHPGWTREQARAHAYTSDPSLYRREQERQEERIAKADAELRERADQADSELRGLVASIRKSDPALGEAKAWKRALDERPDLYFPAAAPRYTAADALVEKAQRDSAHKKFERLAKEIRKSDPLLSRERAYVRAMELRPDWYQ